MLCIVLFEFQTLKSISLNLRACYRSNMFASKKLYMTFVLDYNIHYTTFLKNNFLIFKTTSITYILNLH